MTPDAWGAANRVYPPSSGLPGPRDPQLTPYMIPWCRDLASGAAKMVVQVTAAQSGKTEAILDTIGERLDNQPVPMLYVGPSKEFNTDQFEPRLMALLDEAPTLASKVARGKRMKKTRKVIAGVPLRLAHAGSSTALKSDPAAIAFVDEYDEMLKNIKGQGDPLGLVQARGDTYADFVVGVVSTPSKGPTEIEKDAKTGLEFWKVMPPVEVESAIWKLWQQGTRHHFAWPCKQCGEYFIPRFSCLRWKGSTEEAKTTPKEAFQTAHVVCPRCGGVMHDSDKSSMNERGVYVAPGQTITRAGVVQGAAPEVSVISRWVSGLCSPFVSWGERAETYLEAVRMNDFDKIQTVINAGFGEPFAPAHGDVPEWEEVKDHVGEYAKGEMPDNVRFVVLTADVQKNRIFWVIRGWGPRSTSWLIDYGTLFGETIDEPIWTDLADLITQPVHGMPLKLVLIDSGFRPGKPEELPLNRVYEFCRRFPRQVRPTKGSSTPMRVPLVTSKIEVKPNGKAAKYGLELLRLDPDHWKSWVHERVKWPVDQPGSWHLPYDISEDYCKQLISEGRMRRPSGRAVWVQRSKENHYLDCEAMQAAAAYLLNAQRLPEDRAENPAPRPMATQENTVAAVQVGRVTQTTSDTVRSAKTLRGLYSGFNRGNDGSDRR